MQSTSSLQILLLLTCELLLTQEFALSWGNHSWFRRCAAYFTQVVASSRGSSQLIHAGLPLCSDRWLYRVRSITAKSRGCAAVFRQVVASALEPLQLVHAGGAGSVPVLRLRAGERESGEDLAVCWKVV